jgi:hypothetical protein
MSSRSRARGLGALLAIVAAGCGGDVVGADEAAQESRVSPDGGVQGSPQALVAATGEAQACAAWHSARERYTQAASWRPDAASCGLGSLPGDTRQASLEWVNYYRGLVGLAPVREDANDRSAAQACAVLLERNGQLSHTPPATWACASLAARDAAGRSNLSGNVGFPMSPWYAVRGWIDEGRDLSGTLGHRRWLFSPELHTVTYGQTGSFACMTLGLGARDAHAPASIAWPPAGWVPTAVMGTIWSFSQAGVTAAGTRVEVLRDGAPVSVAVVARAAGLGDDTVSWEMPAAVPGSAYRVTVRVPGRASVAYEVRATGCSRQQSSDRTPAEGWRASGHG